MRARRSGRAVRRSLGSVIAVAIALSSSHADAPTDRSVTGKILVSKNGRRIDPGQLPTVVYLQGAQASSPAAVPVRLHQKDLKFDRRVVVITKGTTVEFPNGDKVFHNVFSVSETKKFDLGLYKSGQSKSVTFKHAGQVDVYCNIHPDMVSTIKIVDTNRFVIADKDGTFRIARVPPGSYTVVAWRPYGTEVRGQVEVTRQRSAEIELEIVDDGAPRPHLRKDGTPYGRYK